MATIGNVTIRIGATAKQLEYDLKRAENALKRSVANMQGLGQRLSIGLTAPIVGLGAVSLRAAGNVQALQKGLTAVMGSAGAAAIEFEKLREVAKLPGLGLEEAARGSVQLQAAGFSADEARRSLLAFGNALATVGKGKNELNFVNLALAQLQNKTSGFGQDLRQLTEQLPQLRGALTNAFGTAESEKIAELGVTGKQVVQVLIQEFEKLPKVTGGINNAFENLSDSVKVALFTVGTSLNEAFGVESIFETIGKKLEALADGFAALSPETRKFIFVSLGVVAALGPALIIFAQITSAIGTIRIAWIALSAAFRVGGLAALLNPVGIVLAGIAATVYLIATNWEQVKRIAAAVGNVFVDLYNNSTVLRGVVQGVVFYFKTWWELLKLIGKSLVNIVTLDFEGLKKDFNEFGNNTLTNFKTGIENTFNADPIKRFGSEVKNVFKDISTLKGFEGNLAPKQKGVRDPIGVLAPKNAPLDLGNLGGGAKIKDLNEQISDLKKNIEALGIAYAQKPSSGILEKLNSQIDLLKSKESILENSEALITRLSGGTSGTIEILPSINFSGAIQSLKNFATTTATTIRTETQKGLLEGLTVNYEESGFSQFFKSLSTDLSNIQRQFDDGLISGLDKNAQQFDFLKGKLDNLTKNGFGKLSPEVIAVKGELDKLGGFEGFSTLVQGVTKINGALAAAAPLVNTLTGIFSDMINSRIEGIDAQQQKEIDAINQTTLSAEEKEKRITATEEKYGKERRALMRKQAIANKVSAIFSATISMFQGLASALAGAPLTLPLLPIIKGLGIANIAAIAAAPLPSLAIGTDYVKSDGMANLHRGEAVVPANVVGGGFSGFGKQNIELHSIIRGNDLHLLNERNKALTQRMR